MKLQSYQNIILPILYEEFDEREAKSLFKYVVELYFNQNYSTCMSLVLDDEATEDLNVIFEKVSNHYPVQYIFNTCYFYDLLFYVDEQVLIPRPETEELVHWILQEQQMPNLAVLDIGSGSGCINVTLKKHRQNWDVVALDVSEAALLITQKNAESNNILVKTLHANILEIDSSFFSQQFDIIVSNPPYIPFNEQEQMSKNTQFEPPIALYVANENPLIFYERIVQLAQQQLKKNGIIYLEINEFNANEVKQLYEDFGYHVVIKQDIQGKNRMIKAEKLN